MLRTLHPIPFPPPNDHRCRRTHFRGCPLSLVHISGEISDVTGQKSDLPAEPVRRFSGPFSHFSDGSVSHFSDDPFSYVSDAGVAAASAQRQALLVYGIGVSEHGVLSWIEPDGRTAGEKVGCGHGCGGGGSWSPEVSGVIFSGEDPALAGLPTIQSSAVKSRSPRWLSW